MGKVIQIEVPDWVDEELANKLKDMLIEKLKELIREDYVDIKIYNLYFTLKFPEAKNVDFDLDKELEHLKKMREKEKERVKWL